MRATSRIFAAVGAFVAVVAVLPRSLAQAAANPPIEKVEVRADGAIYVNGRPFFPLMVWLQDPENFAAAKSCAINTVAGYWPKSGGTRNVREYLDLVWKAGFYGVMPFDESLKGHPALLGYIHDDEPDLPHPVSDAVVEPSKKLKINRGAPLWKLVDGDRFSWSVLDPLEGAAVTLKLKKPVTVESLAVWLTVSKGLSIAKEVAFEADGREILRTTLEPRKGRQKFDLSRPVTFRTLTLRVLSVFPGKNVWGSFAEIEGFDSAGRNVLLSPPRTVPRLTPEETLRRYRVMKRTDPSHPVFMTLTGNFSPFFKKYNEEKRKMYPRFIRAADVVGFDIYPIYGWNKPEWIYLVHDATKRLVRLARPRPVYAWIETSKGGRWTGPLERQKAVGPEHIRAEVWMAVVAGATGIGYFTHVWKPKYKQFGVPPENREAIRKVNEQISRLAPVLLAGKILDGVSIAGNEGVKLDALAKQKDGATYIFAVNYDEKFRKTDAVIKVPGLPAGKTIAVLDENRTINSGDGFFTDTFGPLDVHIYRLK